MSLIGPRPERPEFVKELETQVPYYKVRHTVRPGITGWAQVNYRYGASVEDALRKLEYDLYYLPDIARRSVEAGGHQKHVPPSGSQDPAQDHRGGDLRAGIEHRAGSPSGIDLDSTPVKYSSI